MGQAWPSGRGAALALALLLALAAAPDPSPAASPGSPCSAHAQCEPGRCCAGSCAAAGAVCCGDGLCSAGEDCRLDDSACSGGQWCSGGCAKRPDGVACASDEGCLGGRCSADLSGGLSVCCSSGCARGGSCAPQWTREPGRYCDGLWRELLADGAACPGDAACANGTCARDEAGGPSLCCARRCVSSGACHANGTRLAGMYCLGAWRLQRAEGEPCSAGWECAGGRCAPGPSGGAGACCEAGCALNATCVPALARAGALYCGAQGSWEPQREDGAECRGDAQCAGGSCRYIQPGSICCTPPSCVHQERCLAEGTRLDDRYCTNRTWRYFAASACANDYECSSNRCVDDSDGSGRFCCTTSCVHNGTCYPNHGSAAGLFCNGTAWSRQLSDGSNCTHASECLSDWCPSDRAGAQRCAPYLSCLAGGRAYPSGRSAVIEGGTRHCLEGVWHDCGSDADCQGGGWCDETMTCRPPRCGNGRCETGECAAACADCPLASCLGDGACTRALGEGCWSSPDCPCPAGARCLPSDRRRDASGCVRPACGDGTCDRSEGECSAGCALDCNSTACQGDGTCSPAVGEGCASSADCACPEGLDCRPGEQGVDWRGCYNPACGNKVCDRERAECDSGCPDCTAQDCASDGRCSPAAGERCDASKECACEPPLRCRPQARDADARGCAPPVCGDGSCEGRESCESCPADCGECFSVEPAALSIAVAQGGSGTASLTVSSRSRSAYLVVGVRAELGLPVSVEPARVLLQPGGRAAVNVTVRANGTLPANGSLAVVKQTTGAVLARASIAVVPAGAAPPQVREEVSIRLPRSRVDAAATPGGTAPFSFFVINEGSRTARVAVVVSSRDPAGPWVRLDLEGVDLAPGVQRMVSGRVAVPSDAEEGLYEARVSVRGEGREAEAVLAVTVRARAQAVPCGDGSCAEGESCEGCPQDCPCEGSLELVLPPGPVNASADGSVLIEVGLRNAGGLALEGCAVRIAELGATASPANVSLPPGATARLVLSFGVADAGELSLAVEAVSGGSVLAAANITVRGPPSAQPPRDAALAGRLDALAQMLERARRELGSAGGGRDAERLGQRAQAIGDELERLRGELASGSDAREGVEAAARDVEGLLVEAGELKAGRMAPGPSAGPEAVGGEAPRYRVAWSALLGGAALLALALALGWFLLRRQPPPPAPPQASYYAQYGYRGYPPAY